MALASSTAKGDAQHSTSRVEDGFRIEDGLLAASSSRGSGSSSRRSRIRAIFSYPAPSAQQPRPTAWLDGLRGVAALEVVLHHYHLQFLGFDYNYAYGSKPDMYQWWRLPFIRNYWHSAHAMVNVFFVISGFVLTQRSLSFIQSRQHDKLFTSLSSAVFRRLLRIYLPVIPITFLEMLVIRQKGLPSGFGPVPIPYSATIFEQILHWYNATEKFLNPFHDYNDHWDYLHPYQHVMWTLPLEYFGSIVCYVTVLGIARVTSRKKRLLIVTTIIYLALKRANWWTANFLAGTILADFLLYQENSKSKVHESSSGWSTSWLNKSFWNATFIWSFFLCGLPDPHPEEYSLPGYDLYLRLTPDSFKELEGGGRFWWMIAGIILTVSISQVDELRRLLNSTFCQYLGKISFMLYLIHSVVFEVFGKFWLNWLKYTLSWSVSTAADGTITQVASAPARLVIYLLFWTVMFPLLAIISGIVTRFVDEPSINLSKWLEQQFTKDDDTRDVA